MKFSIVIPTFNEERDIRGTLDALLTMAWKDIEIIVVDDSTDSTPSIVKLYEIHGVKLICPERPEGRCNARNIGILASTGEIVIILNADVRPPPDFIERIAKHYENGFDYVLVRSVVSNLEFLFSRYVNAVASREESGNVDWMEWTEGFSCRRSVAIDAGLFPVGFPVPLCAGEDGYFGDGLRRLGAKKAVDFSIVVRHVAPAQFLEYWQIRVGRGRGSAQVRRFLHRWSIIRISGWAGARIVKNVIFYLSIIPLAFWLYSVTRFSPKGMRDFFPFLYAHLVEQMAFHYGEITSIMEIVKAERSALRNR